MNVTELLNYGAVITAFLASAFWFLSAFVKGVSSDTRDKDGMFLASIKVNGGDLAATMRKQSKYNAIAAFFAGVTAIFQGIVMYLN